MVCMLLLLIVPILGERLPIFLFPFSHFSHFFSLFAVSIFSRSFFSFACLPSGFPVFYLHDVFLALPDANFLPCVAPNSQSIPFSSVVLFYSFFLSFFLKLVFQKVRCCHHLPFFSSPSFFKYFLLNQCVPKSSPLPLSH